VSELREKLEKWANEEDGMHDKHAMEMLRLLWPVIAAAVEAREYARTDDVNGYAGELMHDALAKLEKELQMPPADTRQRDELAEAKWPCEGPTECGPHGTCNACGDRLVWTAGYDAGLAECAGEIEELKRTEKVYLMNQEWIAEAKVQIERLSRITFLLRLAKERDELKGRWQTLFDETFGPGGISWQRDAWREQCEKLKLALEQGSYFSQCVATRTMLTKALAAFEAFKGKPNDFTVAEREEGRSE
jgi:hypothetical protein